MSEKGVPVKLKPARTGPAVYLREQNSLSEWGTVLVMIRVFTPADDIIYYDTLELQPGVTATEFYLAVKEHADEYPLESHTIASYFSDFVNASPLVIQADDPIRQKAKEG